MNSIPISWLIVGILTVINFDWTLVSSTNDNDFYNEELLIKPLANDHVYAYFQFTTIWNVELEQNSCKFAAHYFWIGFDIYFNSS